MPPLETPNQAVSEEVKQAVASPEVEEQVVEQENQSIEQQVPEQGEAPIEVPEDRSAQNIYAENHRKAREIEELRLSIDALKNQVQQTQQIQQPKYTISQLTTMLNERPDLQPQITEEIEKIRQENLLKALDERNQITEKKRLNEQLRMQAEQEVTNMPALKECFVDSPLGGKNFNFSNPLANTIIRQHQAIDPYTGTKLADRPDGLLIAAKLVLADEFYNSKVKTQTSVQKLQKDLRKVQKQTMTVGQGVNSSSGSLSEYQKHKANYEKSYSKSDAFGMVKSIMKNQGMIQEQGE